ncbi:MAG: methyltransferase [Alphaproteobacteria bacterium]|nr:methyltransferase [Alphaproteobacteria bacterium]
MMTANKSGLGVPMQQNTQNNPAFRQDATPPAADLNTSGTAAPEALARPRPQYVEAQEFAPPPEVSFFDKVDMVTGRLKWFIETFAARLGKPVETIYRVGVERYREGEFADAEMRFRMVVKFHPKNIDAWYLMGSSQIILGKNDEAVNSFRQVLALNPQHEEARFLLATIAPRLIPADQQPRISPLRLVVEHFDAAAFDFDEEQLEYMGYRGHEMTYQSVVRFLNPNYQHFKQLDLGCGTGLVGLQFRGIVSRLEGVDISSAMIAQVESRRDDLARRIYDELHLKDLRVFMLEQPADSYDIITASNVFHCIGGLTPVFDGLQHCLKPGGIASFSVEPQDGGDFGLIPGSGRFSHSEQYIREQAARVGLDVVEVLPFEIYFEEQGIQYVVRKPVPASAEQPAAPAPAAPEGNPVG